jgi:hypothetical protein
MRNQDNNKVTAERPGDGGAFTFGMDVAFGLFKRSARLAA